MEEKNAIKIHLSTVFLILSLIIIIIMGFFMYKIYTYKKNADEKVETLNSEVTRLQSTINSIQSTINATNTSNNTAILTDINNKQNNIENNTPIQKNNSKNIIMYGGTNIADFKPGIHYFAYEEARYEDYYNTTYDIYQSGKKIGETRGTVKKEYDEIIGTTNYYIDYENSDIAKEGIFVSCNYNVVPRQYENVTEIPSIIETEFHNCDSIKMQAIDLDGDSKKEYVVAYSNKYENTAGVYLYDSNYEKISMLAIQNSYSEYLSDFNYINFMDIDNDNNMEIIISIPVASSYFRFGIYKYENNAVTGQIDTFGIGG